MNLVSFSEFSVAYFVKRNLNGGGFQSEGAAEGGCGGNSAAPERPAERSEAVSPAQNGFAQSLEYPIMKKNLTKSMVLFHYGDGEI